MALILAAGKAYRTNDEILRRLVAFQTTNQEALDSLVRGKESLKARACGPA